MSTKLAYDRANDGAKFREQYRFAFSIAIIATCFVIPDSNIFWQYLGYAVRASALFSAIYLITSAAQLKYREPGRMYEVFKVSESFRMRVFDWSIHIFAAAFLFFLGILLTGIGFRLFGTPNQEWATWAIVAILTFLIGIVFIFIEHAFSKRDKKNGKALPKI